MKDEYDYSDAPPDVMAFLDQVVATMKEAHGPGHSKAWYRALAMRMVWHKATGGNMGSCPVRMPDE